MQAKLMLNNNQFKYKTSQVDEESHHKTSQLNQNSSSFQGGMVGQD